MFATTAIEVFGIITTFVLAAIGLVLGIHNQRQQSKRDQSVTVIQTEQLQINKRLAEIAVRKEEAASRDALNADLRFLLVSRPYPGSFDMVIANKGQHEAVDVAVRGDDDLGTWARFVSYDRIAAGETKTHSFSNSDWQVIGGQRFRLRYTWTDGAGTHEDATTATT